MAGEQCYPLILVTGPDKRLKYSWWAIRMLLKHCGLRGYYASANTKNCPENIKGIIVSGGDDIDPKHYGLTGDGGAKYDTARDQLELMVVRQAIDTGIPLFGICRGAQLINISLGGSLYSDIRPLREKTSNRNSLFPVKRVDIISDSSLKCILGKSSICINSLHHQAIDRVAEPLMVAANDQDGFIQAVELRKDVQEGLPFILGVQWHPEYIPYASTHRLLFKAFAEKVKSKKVKGTTILLT